VTSGGSPWVVFGRLRAGQPSWIDFCPPTPPRDYKQAPDDYFHQDTLEERLREEVPDRIRPDADEVRLIDDESEDGGGELRSERGDEGGYPSAEDAAMHVVDEALGAVNRKIDSYTGDSTDELE
jgi:hypothetical protein